MSFFTQLSGVYEDMRSALGLVSLPRRISIIAAMILINVIDLIGLGMIIPFILLLVQPGLDPAIHVPLLRYVGEGLAELGLPHSPPIYFFFFAFILLLKSISSVALNHFTAETTSQVAESLRARLSFLLLNSEWDFLSRQRSGALSGAVSHEINAVGQAFNDVASVVAMVLQILIYLLLAALLSWQVAVLALLILCVVIGFFNLILRYRFYLAQLQLEATNQLAATFSDVISSVKLFRGMGRVDSLLDSIAKKSRITSQRLSQKLANSELSAEVLEPLVGLMVLGWFYASLYWFGLVLANVLIIGILLVRVIYLYLTFYRALFRINDGRAQLRSILNLMQRSEDAQEIRPGRMPVPERFDISISKLTFYYGNLCVLREFSLDIPFGSIVSIDGPSGEGKSTLLDLLLALRLPQSGDITISGTSLFSQLDISSWRRSIGYVPQDQYLLNTTILENLTFGDLTVSREDAIVALKIADAWEFVSQLPSQLDYVVGERGQLLSGGQRQRIAIARAIIHKPALLILDEATTALDPKTENQIIANIHALHGRAPFTIISVSHQDRWRTIADMTVSLRRDPVPA